MVEAQATRRATQDLETKKLLPLNGRFDEFWLHERLARPGLQLQIEEGKVHARKEGQMQTMQLAYKPQREQGLTINKHNHQTVQEDTVALVALLKACAKQKDLCKGSGIHADIREKGLLQRNIYIGTVLVTMYAKCGALAKAQEVFEELPVRNVVSWNALITGYTQSGHGHEALKYFERMQHQGLSPDAVTFTCILKACGSIGAVKKGEELHAEIVRQGLFDKDIILGNALVDMYAKCGALAKAQLLFDELPVRDVVSWSVLIAGYVQHGYGLEALNCFEKLKHQGLSPDAVTFISILKACSSVGATKKGEEIHDEVSRRGLLEKDTILGTALVDMYAKGGALTKARQVFDELPVQSVITWNALIAGYAQHGHGHKALDCFEQMQQQGLSPDTVTFTCILKACGSVGAADKGEEVHAEVVRQGLLEKNTILGNSLVDMYVKCGALAKAQEVFNELLFRTVVSWSALITGYAQLGKVEIVFELFSKMIEEGTDPDLVTFIVLLNACSHAGLVEEGQLHYVTMTTRYGIIPTIEHHTCMVDLFSRAGHFDKAMRVIENMSCFDSPDCLPLWSNLLGACRKWGNVDVGRLAFDHVVKVDKKDSAAYVCMRNIYAGASMLEDANEVEAMRVQNNAVEDARVA